MNEFRFIINKSIYVTSPLLAHQLLFLRALHTMADALTLIDQLKVLIPSDARYDALRQSLSEYEMDLKQNAKGTKDSGTVPRPRKPPMMNRGSSISNDLGARPTNSSESRPTKPPIRKNVSRGPLLRLFVKLPIKSENETEPTPEIVIWNDSQDEILKTLDRFCSDYDIAPDFWKNNLHETINRLINAAI